MAHSDPSFDPKTLDLAVGGQAVIEGVMMRCPTAIATAVRTPGGKIVVRRKPFKGVVSRMRFLNLPLIRGAINLVETMSLGMSALMFSAEQAMEEDAVEERDASLKEKLTMWGTLVVAFGLGMGLFYWMPLVLTDLTMDAAKLEGGLAFNLIDAFYRVLAFVLYILAISQMKDMRRVFQYHGAEHKTIHVFENHLPLTPENARRFSTLHPRCGTSFLFFVMAISILVFLFMGRPEGVVERLQRLTLVPVIGGIAYEVIRFSGKHAQKRWIRPLILPGMMLQKITTKEPTDDQVEVAMAALKSVLESEAIDFVEKSYLELADTPS